MTNEELAAEIAAIAGRLGDIAVRLSAPRDPKPDSVLQPAAVIDIEDVRAVLTKVSGKHGAAATKELMAPHKKLSDIPHTEWAALIAKAEALL